MSAAMAGARDPWWVIGSAAAALHGAPVRAADVDVLLGMEDARRLLPALGVEPHPGGPHSLFRSDLFGTWRDGPLPVEFMAGFRCRDGRRWIPVRPVTRQSVAVGDAVVHLPSRDELKSMMERFGRPKDLERAALL